jgi:hypothetical protein
MTPQEFVDLVKQMWDAQKRWLQSDKSSATLAEAKALERAVDRAFENISDTQRRLFGEEP